MKVARVEASQVRGLDGGVLLGTVHGGQVHNLAGGGLLGTEPEGLQGGSAALGGLEGDGVVLGGLEGGGALLQGTELLHAAAGVIYLLPFVSVCGVGYVFHVRPDGFPVLQEPTPMFRAGLLLRFP